MKLEKTKFTINHKGVKYTLCQHFPNGQNQLIIFADGNIVFNSILKKVYSLTKTSAFMWVRTCAAGRKS